jgi:hypothetical protein
METMIRDTLFISHATPEDNEFAIWIASRLEMLGYKTWIDREGLLGGERFWQTIQNIIKNAAIKVLLVYSRNICRSDGDLKDGIDKEISYSEGIARENNLADFIIPLNIDNSASYNQFIGSNRLNHVPFSKNWAEGLKQLLKKLEKDSVPKSFSHTESSLSEWYETEYVSDCSIIQKQETFYSSWWKIKALPEIFYLYKFHNEQSSTLVLKSNGNVSVSRFSNHLISFEKSLSFSVDNNGERYNILPEKVFILKIDEVLSGFESQEFPSRRDAENGLKMLLLKVLQLLFLQKNLDVYRMSNNIPAYYLPRTDSSQKIKFIYPNTSILKRKNINGVFTDIGFWHYALSLRIVLSPFVGFSLKTHLIFTTDGILPIQDVDKQHSYRRSKGKRLFNKEWLDMQLAFIQRLKSDTGVITIKVSQDDYVEMEEWPLIFQSEVGYIEPDDEMNIEQVENFLDDETGEEETIIG